MATIVETLKCPVCGWHWSLEAKGSKRTTRGQIADSTRGKFTFRRVNPQGKIFISLRTYQGKREGLPQVDIVTLKQARDMSKYQELIAYSSRASLFNLESACTWPKSFQIFNDPSH